VKNRRWLLRSRPVRNVAAGDFELQPEPLQAPSLQPGQVLVRNRAFLCAPTLRNWLNEAGPSSRVTIGLGESIRGPGAAEVVGSANEQWPVGSRFTGVTPWQDYAVHSLDAVTTPVIRIPDGMTEIEALGPFGVNALTAYFGLTQVAQPRPGETVVVSAAAGSVGSCAVQVAKILGGRVIGIAGGRDKCDRWVTEVCGADAAIDYKTEDVRARLAQLCPAGVDVFFDNVGGEILQAVTDNTAIHARIAVCGQISAYDSDAPAPGPRDMMRVVYWRIRMQGFLVGDYVADVPRARAQLRDWMDRGLLRHRTDVRHGFERLPEALVDIFRGSNTGTLIVTTD
jgi:NADPH-dependent curcumin reductase CurA